MFVAAVAVVVDDVVVVVVVDYENYDISIMKRNAISV